MQSGSGVGRGRKDFPSQSNRCSYKSCRNTAQPKRPWAAHSNRVLFDRVSFWADSLSKRHRIARVAPNRGSKLTPTDLPDPARFWPSGARLNPTEWPGLYQLERFGSLNVLKCEFSPDTRRMRRATGPPLLRAYHAPPPHGALELHCPTGIMSQPVSRSSNPIHIIHSLGYSGPAVLNARPRLLGFYNVTTQGD